MSSSDNTSYGENLSSLSLQEAAAQSEYGVQEDGSFEAPYLDDIVARMEAALEDRIPGYDAAPGSPVQQLLEVFALEAEALWESQRELYYTAFLDSSFGRNLDELLSLAGVSRLSRQGATGEVTFFSSASGGATRDYQIPSGTRVAAPQSGSAPDIPFKTTEAATLRAGETEVTRVPVRALSQYETDIDTQYLGAATNLPAGAITRLVDGVAGIGAGANDTPVANVLATGSAGTRDDGSKYSFQRGRDRETDAELKARYKESLGLGGKASLSAIQAAVFNVEGVSNVDIEENVQENWFRVTALADTGRANDIAQAIADTRSAGIESRGSATGTAMVIGQAVQERFDFAGLVSIHVDVDLEITSEFPDDGEEQIMNNIVSYIGGETLEGENRTGLAIGTDVSHYKVASACDIRGVYDAEVILGTGDTTYSPGENATITEKQVAETSPSVIDVTTTTITPP